MVASIVNTSAKTSAAAAAIAFIRASAFNRSVHCRYKSPSNSQTVRTKSSDWVSEWEKKGYISISKCARCGYTFLPSNFNFFLTIESNGLAAMACEDVQSTVVSSFGELTLQQQQQQKQLGWPCQLVQRIAFCCLLFAVARVPGNTVSKPLKHTEKTRSKKRKKALLAFELKLKHHHHHHHQHRWWSCSESNCKKKLCSNN